MARKDEAHAETIPAAAAARALSRILAAIGALQSREEHLRGLVGDDGVSIDEIGDLEDAALDLLLIPENHREMVRWAFEKSSLTGESSKVDHLLLLERIGVLKEVRSVEFADGKRIAAVDPPELLPRVQQLFS